MSKYFGLANKFVIGHEAEAASPGLAASSAMDCWKADAQVTTIGLSSTPRVYWHGAQYNFDCSVQVTASHCRQVQRLQNLSEKEAIPISSEDGLIEIENIFNGLNGCNQLDQLDQAAALVTRGQAESQGRFLIDTLGFDEYVRDLRSHLSISGPLEIVVDAGGSPVGREVTASFQGTGITVHELGFEPDGTFKRRSANPLDDGALLEVSEKVKSTGANFGAAFDGDGDRVAFVDESGALAIR